jgi:hypothetical protein
MDRMRDGGEMPSLQELMADPTLRDMYVLSFSLSLRSRAVLTLVQGRPDDGHRRRRRAAPAAGQRVRQRVRLSCWDVSPGDVIGLHWRRRADV